MYIYDKMSFVDVTLYQNIFHGNGKKHISKIMNTLILSFEIHLDLLICIIPNSSCSHDKRHQTSLHRGCIWSFTRLKQTHTTGGKLRNRLHFCLNQVHLTLSSGTFFWSLVVFLWNMCHLLSAVRKLTILLVWHVNLATPNLVILMLSPRKTPDIFGFKNLFQTPQDIIRKHIYIKLELRHNLPVVEKFGDTRFWPDSDGYASESVRSHFLACFLQMAMYSSTSSVEPRATGDRWWMLSGWMSRMFSKPVEAMPPACSMMQAIGLPSYSSRSFEEEGVQSLLLILNSPKGTFK